MLSFVDLTLDDGSKIKKFVSHVDSYSDFNFLSLYSWSLHAQTKFCLTDAALFLIIHDYVSQEPIYTFLSSQQPVQSLQVYIKWLKAQSLPKNFELVPDFMVPEIVEYLQSEGKEHRIEEDRGAFDYILDVGQVTNAIGSKYESFRYKLSKFNRMWGDKVTSITFNPDLEADKLQAVKLAEKWAAHKKSRNQPYKDELFAFNKFLVAAKEDPTLLFTALEHQGSLVGLASSEILSDSKSIGHFLKYDPNYQGIYYRLVKDMCEKLSSKNIHFLNIEQDLNLQGLREAKMSLRPVKFLKKYRLTIEN